MSKQRHRTTGRRRDHYWLGVEFSGLERPRQWVGAVLTVVAVVLAMGLFAFIAFG